MTSLWRICYVIDDIPIEGAFTIVVFICTRIGCLLHNIDDIFIAFYILNFDVIIKGFCLCLSRQLDGYLHVGLIVEDKPTKFSCTCICMYWYMVYTL